MAITLTDDGTLDTVLRCSECGEELRYNFANDNGPELADEHAQAYDEWLQFIIEDATADHECEPATRTLEDD